MTICSRLDRRVWLCTACKKYSAQEEKRRARAPFPSPTRYRRPSAEIAEQAEEAFHMTYKAARHEAVWLESSLEYFFQHKWFDDVLRMVKGGKEASVYLCQGNATTGEEYLAAKVYRPRLFRNLRNDWLYREGRSNLDESGREITNKGMLHAMRKRTEYGRELLHTSWLEHEYQTLTILHEAGADVPRPFASGSNAILMSYYGDEVMGAPTLNDVSLPAGEARRCSTGCIHNIDLMLARPHSRRPFRVQYPVLGRRHRPDRLSPGDPPAGKPQRLPHF